MSPLALTSLYACWLLTMFISGSRDLVNLKGVLGKFVVKGKFLRRIGLGCHCLKLLVVKFSCDKPQVTCAHFSVEANSCFLFTAYFCLPSPKSPILVHAAYLELTTLVALK